jgi:hypothetical protein
LRGRLSIVNLGRHAGPFADLDDVDAFVESLELTVLDPLWERQFSADILAVDVDEQVSEGGVFLLPLFFVLDIVFGEEAVLTLINSLAGRRAFV